MRDCTDVKDDAQGARILVICPYPQGVAGGQRLKYEQYLDDWRSMGFEVDVRPFMDLNMWSVVHQSGHTTEKIVGTIRGNIRRTMHMHEVSEYDLVYVFMWVTPLGTTLYERILRHYAKRLIFDVEDPVVTDDSPSGGKGPLPWLRGPAKPRYLAQVADHVVVASPYVHGLCLKLNRYRQCTLVPPSINTERFLPACSYTNDETVTIGWTGTFSSQVYLDNLRGVFRELAKRVQFKLRVIGNFDYSLQGVDLEVVRWTKEKEVEDLQALDIGVYPLSDETWVLGKAGLKAIQYMAFGLPTVATDLGAAQGILRDGENGFLVTSEAEWVGRLEQLVRDPTLRARLGKQARSDAVRGYSQKVVADQYRRVLRSTLRGR